MNKTCRAITDLLYRRLAVGSNVQLGRNVHVGFGSRLWAPRRLVVGDGTYIGKYVTIEVDGEIGDYCLVANGVGLVGRTDHDIDVVGTPIAAAPWVGNEPARLSRNTTIGHDVWIGYGAIVLSGVTVGNSCVIGAGSVVTRDIAPNSIAVGNPARVIARRFDDDEWAVHRKKIEQRRRANTNG